MVTILSDEKAHSMGQAIYEDFTKTRHYVKHFPLGNMRIEPCYACRGCELKTFRRCVIRDDADLLLPELVRSEIIIVLTPITFGSYSFQVKRAVDKFNLICDLHYYYNKGELVKGFSPTGVKYYAVGICDNKETAAIRAFENLIKETLIIAGWEGKPIIASNDAGDLNRILREIAEK